MCKSSSRRRLLVFTENMVSRYALIRTWPLTYCRAFAHSVESLCEACSREAGLYLVGIDSGSYLFLAAATRCAYVPALDLAIRPQQRMYGGDLLFTVDRSLSVRRLLASLSNGARSSSSPADA